jgi:hypothetical protein
MSVMVILVPLSGLRRWLRRPIRAPRPRIKIEEWRG